MLFKNVKTQRNSFPHVIFALTGRKKIGRLNSSPGGDMTAATRDPLDLFKTVLFKTFLSDIGSLPTMRQNNQSFFGKTVFHQKRGKKERDSIRGVKQWNFGTSTAHQIQSRYFGKTFLSCTRLPCTTGNRFTPAEEQTHDVQQQGKHEKDR